MVDFTFKVHKDIMIVKDYLTDTAKFVTVHPLIYKMTDLGGHKYKVFEKIRIGRIPYHFTYKAVITQDGDVVKIEATVAGLTRISMHFTIQEAGNGETIIHEKLTVKSPLPIKNYMNNLIEKQHHVMFQNIETAG